MSTAPAARQPQSPPEPPLVVLVAFAAEHELAERSLGAIAHLPASRVALLGSPDDRLEALATRRGIDWLPHLPACERSERYWVDVLQPLCNVVADAVILRAGTSLPPFTVERLLAAAPTATPCILFPLSAVHPLSSAFPAGAVTPGLPVDATDRWLNRFARGKLIDLPLLCGQTALVRGARALSRVCPESDTALAAALHNAGWRLLVSDAVYVDDRETRAAALPESLHEGWRDAFVRRHPLTGMRHALAQIAARGELPPDSLPAARPVRLHVMHSWGGGLEKWVQEFSAADTAHHHLFLRPVGDWSAFAQALVLSAGSPHAAPLERWALARPILSTAIAHEEYARIIHGVVRRYGVHSVLISSLIGHALAALHTGRPTLWLAHDFYPLCPPLVATFRTPCESCEPERMRACLTANPEHRFFRYEDFDHWQALKRHFLTAVSAQRPLAVVPTRSVGERLKQLAPELADTVFHVIPHGLPAAFIQRMEPVRCAWGTSTSDRGRLRIVIPGLLQSQKGLALLESSLPALCERAELLLLGTGPEGVRFKGVAGIEVIERYTPDSFAAALQRFAPDLGLLLSVVPETFSYTLSELQAAGIPVAATRIGAFADRIAHGQDGWLFDPTPEGLSALLAHLGQCPEEIPQVRRAVLDATPRSATAMVEDYRSLEARRGGQLPIVVRPLWLSEAAGANGQDSAGTAAALDTTLPYRTVAAAFLRYTLNKLQASPRVPAWLRRAFRGLQRRG